MISEINCQIESRLLTFYELEKGFYKCVTGNLSINGIIIYHDGCGTQRADNYRTFAINPNGTVCKMHNGCFRILMNPLRIWPFIWFEGDLKDSLWKQISGKISVELDIP